jgi:hypothetical protein
VPVRTSTRPPVRSPTGNRRTDEDGNEVDYDYTSGEWGDGWSPDDARRDDIGDEDADGDPATVGLNRE